MVCESLFVVTGDVYSLNEAGMMDSESLWGLECNVTCVHDEGESLSIMLIVCLDLGPTLSKRDSLTAELYLWG